MYALPVTSIVLSGIEIGLNEWLGVLKFNFFFTAITGLWQLLDIGDLVGSSSIAGDFAVPIENNFFLILF